MDNGQPQQPSDQKFSPTINSNIQPTALNKQKITFTDILLCLRIEAQNLGPHSPSDRQENSGK